MVCRMNESKSVNLGTRRAGCVYVDSVDMPFNDTHIHTVSPSRLMYFPSTPLSLLGSIRGSSVLSSELYHLVPCSDIDS
jgi:hypothetical protein